jgi:lambda family phage tail tape measure protein
MANIARLGVVLGINTADFQAGIKSAMQSVEKLVNALPKIGLAAAAAGAGLAVLVKKGIDELDKLDEVSQKIGVTVESLSSLGKVAKIEGMSIDDLAGSLVKLTRTIGEANTGSEAAAQTFKSMGLDPSTFKNSEDALLQISDKFSQYRDGLNKTALAVDLFGKSGAAMIPFLNQGSDVIKQIRGDLDSFGNASTKAAFEAAEFNDRMAKMGIVVSTVFQKFISELLPTLNNFTQALFDTFTYSDLLRNEVNKLVAIQAVRWAENLAIALAHIVDVGVFVARTMIAIGSSIRVVANDIIVLYKGLQFFTPSGVTDTMAVYEDLKKSLEDRKDALEYATNAYNKLTDTNGVFFTNLTKQSVEYARLARMFQYDEFGSDGAPIGKPDAPAGYTKPKSGKENNMLAEARKLSAEYERERNHSLDMLRIRDQMAGYTENERRVQEAVNEVLDATSKKLQEIADKREAAAGRDANAEVLAEYDKQAAAVQELGYQYAELAKIQETSSIAAQQTFSYGWNQAFAQYAEDATNYAMMARDMFSAVTGSMSNAIDQFVESGKFSFKDFAGSIIKDLIKIELKMQAMQLFRMGFAAVTSAVGNYQTMYGNGGFGTGNQFGNQDLGGYLADGGTANANTPYVVGERGAEIFVPGRTGTVIPNEMAFGNNNNGGVTYNGTVIQNMNAIDTQSGLQFLAKNKMNIYALNQSAGRSMPTSR